MSRGTSLFRVPVPGQNFEMKRGTRNGTEQIFKISAERGTGTGQTGKIMPIPGLDYYFVGYLMLVTNGF